MQLILKVKLPPIRYSDDSCKFIVTLRHGVTINSRRSSSPLVRVVELKDNCKYGIVVYGTAMLTTEPYGMGSNPGEGMDFCKCIVPLRHGGTLNSRRTAFPLVRLVEWEERCEANDHPPGCSISKLGWN
ncbi:uncharacterized protein TNCV_656851 [Trichonephila clavipes]|nr:uncharacterized protein TNCV_656851 [Trichonephila clavipes]